MSGLRLRLTDVFAAPRLAREIAESLGGRYWVTDWTRYHAQFFRALRIEKTAMFIILTLIVAVAAFNLVSTLVMVVNEKGPEIRNPAHPRTHPHERARDIPRPGDADRPRGNRGRGGGGDGPRGQPRSGRFPPSSG